MANFIVASHNYSTRVDPVLAEGNEKVYRGIITVLACKDNLQLHYVIVYLIFMICLYIDINQMLERYK